MVYRIETEGRIPGVDVVERLARVLNVAPGWLAYGIDVEASPQGDVWACSAMGERLRELRETRGFTQRALGELAGVTHHAIHSTEVARTLPSVATAEQLADALDVSPAWLAYGEGPQVIIRRRARKRP